MKGIKVLIVASIVLFVLMILLQMRMPRRFQWNSTFDHNDSNPYGCFVFDSVMSQCAPGGYSVTDSTLYMLEANHGHPERETYLVADTYMRFTETEAQAIKRLLKRGAVVILASNSFSTSDYDNELSDFFELEIEDNGRYSHPSSISELIGGGKNDTITWTGNGGFAARSYCMPIIWTDQRITCNRAHTTLMVDDYWDDESYHVTYYDYDDDVADVTEVIEDEDYYADYADDEDANNHEVEKAEYSATPTRVSDKIAISLPVGKGTLVVTTMAHQFTNYGILDPAMREIALRLLSQGGASRHIIRYDSSLRYSQYNDIDEGGESSSPLSYMLNNAPLRWGLYVCVMAILLFMFFTARRRQRAIPVINEPADQSMALVEHIGTLYYERHDNADLLHKKYLYFTEHLRREVMVDIDDADHLDSEIETLSQITGMPREAVADDIARLQAALAADAITNADLKRLCDAMDYIKAAVG